MVFMHCTNARSIYRYLHSVQEREFFVLLIVMLDQRSDRPLTSMHCMSMPAKCTTSECRAHVRSIVNISVSISSILKFVLGSLAITT